MSHDTHLYDDNYPFNSKSLNKDIYCKECNSHLGFYNHGEISEYNKKYIIFRVQKNP